MKILAIVSLALLTACFPSRTASADIIKGNSFGDPKAPLLIEVFSDFQCPACKNIHDTEIPQLIKDYVATGKAYLIYRYFPLDGHQYGRTAAEYACAAAQIGKYQPAADALFARQEHWAMDGKVEQTVNDVLTAPEQLRVKALTKSAPVQAEISHDLEEGRGVPVQSTPTMLVTYRLKRYPLSGAGAMNYSLLKAFLDDLLGKK